MPPAPARPPLPDTVRYAFYLMLAGAAIQLLGVLGVFTQTDAIREAVTESLRNDPNVTEEMIDTGVTVGITFFVIVGLLGTGLWVWMAYANKAGKNWARITGTVFFGIATLGALSSLGGAAGGSSAMAGSGTGVNTAFTLINWLIGLAVVILLWNRRSTPHFKPLADHGYGYQPPGQASGYPYPQSGPAPGQTAPPPPPPPGGGPGDMPPPR
jgi:hypothetical protein